MFIVANGIKAWVIGLIILVTSILILVGLFYLGLLLLPVIITLALLSYLFKVLNKLKKEKTHDYINIKYKIKK